MPRVVNVYFDRPRQLLPNCGKASNYPDGLLTIKSGLLLDAML